MHFQFWPFDVKAISQFHRKEVIMDSCVLLLALVNKSVFHHWIRLLYTMVISPLKCSTLMLLFSAKMLGFPEIGH